MDNLFKATAGDFISREFSILISLVILLCLVISGCASSEVSRNVASNVDLGVQNAKNMVNGDSGNISDTYQNTSQTTKGVLLGGAAGAVAGGFTPAVGLIAGTAMGAVIGGSYGAYIDSYATLEDKLENRGVNVMVLGDQVMIVMRSSRLFDYMTPVIKPQSYSTLRLVAEYINQFTKTLVKISVYTADTGSRRVDVSLSQEQANNLSRMLQALGVDARLLYAAGYGGIHPVQKNTMDWENSDNYRVEITLEKLYV